MAFWVRPPRAGFGLTSSDLNNLEWRAIEPLLPRPRGIKRVDDRRVLNGILWRDAGVWSRIVQAVTNARDGRIELIDAAMACVPPSHQRTPIVANDAVAWRVSA
jgi:hypothetical protein